MLASGNKLKFLSYQDTEYASIIIVSLTMLHLDFIVGNMIFTNTCAASGVGRDYHACIIDFT